MKLQKIIGTALLSTLMLPAIALLSGCTHERREREVIVERRRPVVEHETVIVHDHDRYYHDGYYHDREWDHH